MQQSYFTRNELIALRERATEASQTPGQNILWHMAYMELAKAANTLDAMIARTNVIGTQGPPVEIGSECTAPDCDCDGTSGCEKDMD